MRGFLKRLSGTAADIVALDRLKQHLRLDHEDDDELIRDYLAAAVDLVERETSRILAPAVFEWRIDEWPCGTRFLALPVGPVRDVLSIAYIDAEEIEQSLPATDWDWEPSDTGATIVFDAAFAPPLLGRDLGGIRIGFEAGHDQNGALSTESATDLALPRLAQPVLMLIVGGFYAQRESITPEKFEEIPLGAQRLIQRLRIYR